MARLPSPGGDQGNWGEVLNDYLSVSHKSDGTLNLIAENQLDAAVKAKLNTSYSGTPADGSITTVKLASDAVTDAKVAPAAAIAKSKLAPLNIVDADVSAISQNKVTGLAATLSTYATNTALTAASTSDRSRSNHTGTQLASSISDLTEFVQDTVAGFLGAGTNIAVAYDDTNNTLTLSSSGSAGLSAYQVAVNDGFVGTSTQWLASLQGTQGIQGNAGNPGNNGVISWGPFTAAAAPDATDGVQIGDLGIMLL